MRHRLLDLGVQLCIGLTVAITSVLGPIFLVAISALGGVASIPVVIFDLFGAMASSWITLFPYFVYIGLAMILSALRQKSTLWSFGSHLVAAAVATASSAALWWSTGDDGAGALLVHGGVAALALRFALAVCVTHLIVGIVRARRREAVVVDSGVPPLASPQ
ncbi:MAG: hypothetical protein ACO1N6_05655 [Microcella sp.]